MNIRFSRIYLTAYLAVAATVASAPAHAESTSITLRAEQIPLPSIPKVAKILERRFESLESGFFTTVESKTSADRITLRFGGWSPSATQIDYLTKTRGKFRLILEGEKIPMATQDDIADARALSGGSRKELAIRLTESAARRVAALTQGASGRLLFIEWEGKVLDRVLIAGPLARDIALSINSPVDVLVMSAALRGGALPDELHLISLK